MKKCLSFVWSAKRRGLCLILFMFIVPIQTLNTMETNMELIKYFRIWILPYELVAKQLIISLDKKNNN